MGDIRKNANIVSIPTSPNTNFFKYWLDFLKPLHNLTNREVDILAHFLKLRYELSKGIKDEVLLDKVLFNTDNKKLVKEELNISSSFFQVVLSKFKKLGIIKDDRVNKRYIPNFEQDSKEFKLIIRFDFNETT